MPASYGGSSGPITAAAIAAVLVAAFALLSGGERAATLGLTRHGQLVTVQDAGAADAVAAVAVTPGTVGQVLTVSDAGLPHWAAASGGTPWGSTVVDGLLGTGWSAVATPAGTSATWTASTLVLSVPSGVSGTVRQQHDDEIADGATAWDLAVRLQATTGSGTTTAVVGVYWIFNGGATEYFGVNVRGDGALYVGWATPTVGSAAYASTTLSLGGGQSWVRLSRTEAGQQVVWYGEGSGGALPTQWARRYVLDTAEGASVRPVAVQIVAAGVSGAPSVDWGATVRAIRTTSAGAL